MRVFYIPVRWQRSPSKPLQRTFSTPYSSFAFYTLLGIYFARQNDPFNVKKRNEINPRAKCFNTARSTYGSSCAEFINHKRLVSRRLLKPIQVYDDFRLRTDVGLLLSAAYYLLPRIFIWNLRTAGSFRVKRKSEFSFFLQRVRRRVDQLWRRERREKELYSLERS